ncbi:MAG: VWA domain-containing protein [Pyrinomonadaceae bacterium]|nr:VWA domain-containing protein [Pyrinomonadaceae bacterium]
MRYLIFSIFIIIFSLTSVFAQDDDVIKVDSTIVRLNVGVVDRSGNPITTLTKDSFTVYEDGVKQNIISFEPTETPFSVAMLLDMSGSTQSFRQILKMSAFRFVDALANEDRISVIEFYDKINVLNDFTTNRKDIGSSIELSNGRGKTQVYKAIDLAIEKISKEGKRRKAIIVLTDGIDTELQNKDRSFLSNVKESEILSAIKPEKNDLLNKILEKADKQNVTIYPLALPTGDPKKLADPTPMQFAMYDAARSRLQILADRTGGKLNAINRLEEMGRFYASVAADIRSLYTIEYQPNNDKRDGKFRNIKIEVNNPNLIAKTKQGYFAK